ncbi:MAG TPA: ImmA/IrrE family metallo-endopeptidase [Bacilli bacterium]|nr:ImmA/IrrE family metallo-endopeptidase [Bacilli bacterium]
MRLTELEKAVCNLLDRYEIRQPDDIDLDAIAYEEEVYVYYMEAPTTSRILQGMASVVVDQRLSPDQQRVELAHELGHLLRNHAGHQGRSHQMFRDLQEWQANNFALYLLCPTFMLVERMEQGEQAIRLARKFRVPERFMKQRLQLLETQHFAKLVDEQTTRRLEQNPKPGLDYSFVRTIGNTQFYCDSAGHVLFQRRHLD